MAKKLNFETLIIEHIELDVASIAGEVIYTKNNNTIVNSSLSSVLDLKNTHLSTILDLSDIIKNLEKNEKVQVTVYVALKNLEDALSLASIIGVDYYTILCDNSVQTRYNKWIQSLFKKISNKGGKHIFGIFDALDKSGDNITPILKLIDDYYKPLYKYKKIGGIKLPVYGGSQVLESIEKILAKAVLDGQSMEMIDKKINLTDINSILENETKKNEIVKYDLPMYDVIYEFSNGLARIKLDGKYGFINTKGKEIVELVYDDLNDFSDGFALFKQYGKIGLISTDGKEIVNLVCDCLYNFKNGFALFKQNGKYGFINTDGKVVVGPIYDDLNEFSEGFALFKQNGKYGFINTDGKVVVGPIYDDLNEFSEGFALFSHNGKYGFINTDGKVVVGPIYDDLDEFKNLFSQFKQNGKYGFINTDGKVVVEPEYDYLDEFSEGFALFKQNGKYGFINTDGKVVVEPEYDYLDEFSEGFALFKQNGKYGFINTDGKVVVEPVYDDLDEFSEGLSKFKQNGKYGFINTDGKVVVEPVYDDILDFKKGFALFRQNKKWGIINSIGRVVVEPDYNSIYIDNINGEFIAISRSYDEGKIHNIYLNTINLDTLNGLKKIFSDKADANQIKDYLYNTSEQKEYRKEYIDNRLDRTMGQMFIDHPYLRETILQKPYESGLAEYHIAQPNRVFTEAIVEYFAPQTPKKGKTFNIGSKLNNFYNNFLHNVARLMGGNPLRTKKPSNINLNIVPKYRGLLSTGSFGRYKDGLWDHVDFQTNTIESDEILKIRFTINHHKDETISLRRGIHDSVVHTIKMNGQILDSSKIVRKKNGQVQVELKKGKSKIEYNLNKGINPIIPKIDNISYTDRINKSGMSEYANSIGDLPIDLQSFLDGIKNKSSEEKIIAIQTYISNYFYYDYSNGEVNIEKSKLTPEQQIQFMRQRVITLRSRNSKLKVLNKKLYAGVCYDICLLRCMMMRKVGLACGIIDGYLNGDLARPHVTNWVAFEGEDGMEMVEIDGFENGELLSGATLIESINNQEKMKVYQDRLNEKIIKNNKINHENKMIDLQKSLISSIIELIKICNENQDSITKAAILQKRNTLNKDFKVDDEILRSVKKLLEDSDILEKPKIQLSYTKAVSDSRS